MAQNTNDYENQYSEEEQMFAYLAAERIKKQTLSEAEGVYQEGKSFGHPSYVKYGALFFLAGIVDLVDLADFTGISMVITRIFSLMCSMIIFLTLWFTNGKVKKAHQYTEEIGDKIIMFRQNIQDATRLAMKTAKLLRRSPIARNLTRKVAREIPRTLVKIRRVARKNPATKILVGAAIDLIPFVAIFNLSIFWVYMSYQDEKKSYNHAEIAAEEIPSQVLDENSANAV